MLQFLFSQENIVTVGIAALVTVVSHVLLRKRQFMVHGAILYIFWIVAVALLLVLDTYSIYHGSIFYFVPFYLALDYYWARRNLEEEVISLEKMRKIKVNFAAIFTAWAVLAYIELPFFSNFQKSALVTVAAILWLDYGLYKGKFIRGGTPFSQR